MQVTQTTIAKTILSAAALRGAVTDASSSYQIDLTWNGARLQGRLGGWWFPETISLERSPHGLIGYVTSRSVRLTVHVALTDARLELLIAGHGCTETIDLELSDAPSGVWFERSSQHTPIQLERTETGYLAVAGQQRATLSAPDSPDWVALSAALVSLAAQRAVSSAMLESLRAMREQ